MSYKILSVDDSRTIRMIVKKAFSPYECELFEAENGSEGLALATREKPDLIILDITMPVMTGVEMLKKLKQEEDLKSIPVIMLTAESGKDNVMGIVKMGVKDYMVKPFKGEQLIERVKSIIDLTPRFDPDADSETDKEINLFSAINDIVILTLPAKINRSISTQIEATTKEKLVKLSAAGARKCILNLSKLANLNMTAIQLVIAVANMLARAKLIVRIVASESQKESMKGFQETSAFASFSTIEKAKESF